MAASHGSPHPSDPFAHGQAARADHETSHGPADAGDSHAVAAPADDAHAGHAHGAWHGPHEAPPAMSYVLVVLAVGAVVAGLVGIPSALGGGNTIEHFLHPSFTAQAATEEAAPGTAALHQPAEDTAVRPAGAPAAEGPVEAADATGGEGGMSRAGEIGLMLFSVLIGVVGIWVAYRFYVRRPEIAERLAARFATAHRVLTNKYYVDEIYDATIIAGTLGSARGLWTVDCRVVDGAVNGSGWFTIFASWVSHLIDKYLVDGMVNLVGAIVERSSFAFRRVQTGLVQNYALVMLFGVFAFVSVYLMLWR